MRPRTFTDEELLCTARACFLEHGPGVSTATIASALGVSQAALFRRVGTKEELMLRALRPTEPPWLKLLQAEPGPESADVQLLHLAHTMDGFFRQLMPLLSVLAAAGIDPHRMIQSTPEPLPTKTHQCLARWLSHFQERGEIRTDIPPIDLASMFAGSLQSRHMMRHVLGDRAPQQSDDYVGNVVRTLLHGAAGPSARPPSPSTDTSSP